MKLIFTFMFQEDLKLDEASLKISKEMITFGMMVANIYI